jgi:gliding motility-associated-like protein
MFCSRGAKYVLFTLLLITSLFASAQQPTGNFGANTTAGCAPQLIVFNDSSTGNPVYWRWDLGNGTISFLQNPSVTYFSPGQYTVRLTVKNANGDSAVVIKSNYITIHALPTVLFTGSPLSGCAPLRVNFTDASQAGSGTITQWQWDMGDGTITTTQNPNNTYTTPGNYNITLQVTNSFGCNNIITKSQYVRVADGVTADFMSNVVSSCQAPFAVNFQSTVSGIGPYTYRWNFGDGGTATTANPSHTYATTGSFNVRLIVTNSGGCSDTIIKTSYINIGNYSASFSAPTTACVNVPVMFTSTSTPAPNSVAWNFGDGNTSVVNNPTHTYTSPGTYTVRYIGDFGGCFDTTFRTITIFAKPTANFTAPVTSACRPPLTVNFTNTSLAATTFNWNFGDGGTSTQRNPTHTYTSVGLFTVTLIATNASGCSDTLIMPDFVKIQPPRAVINNIPRAGCSPLTHTFSASVTSVDAVIGYEWDFGDGGTSTLANPTHTFATGQYDIKLIVTTAGGCTDTVIVERGITATVKPTANFSATPRDACAFQEISFTDLTTGTATSWLWLFGDGGTSTDQNPRYEYSDTGYFNVTLIACNGGCCDTLVLRNYIHISPPIANFSVPLDCNNKFFKQFTDASVGADEWNWNFGDGTTSTLQNPSHTYATVGTYIVSLRVKNNTTGCEHSKTISVVIIDEQADFTTSADTICRSIPIIFTAATATNIANVASYTWDFGDGGSGTGSNPTHTYSQSGNYSVRLIVTDIQGCADTVLKTLRIRVNGPIAAFTTGASGFCLLSTVTFTDNSTNDGINPIKTWIWNYGDGIIDTLTAAPFQHLYAAPGTYAVTLKVIDSTGCADSITINQPLIISKPIANFISIDTLSCPTRDIRFTNNSTGSGVTYVWHFGDGNTSTQLQPTHQYASDGLYTVRLIITDQYGCVDTLTRPNYIRIVSPQSSYTLSDTLSTCPPLLVTFTNNSQNYVSAVWDFGDGSSTTAANPTHFYTAIGTYVTTLTVTSPGGCVSVSQRTIVVRGPQGTFSYSPLNGCKPLQVNFNAITQDRISFIWDFNDGSTRVTTDSVLNYTYTIPGTYVPKMILVDSNGCVVPVQGPDTIFVSGAVAKFGLDAVTLCDNGFVTFKDSSTVSNDVISSYSWNFGDGNTSSLQNPVHRYAATGIYYPQLIVTTQNGCVDTMRLPAPVKIIASPQVLINNARNGCAELHVDFRGSLAVPDTSTIKWLWSFGNGNTSNLQVPPQQIYTNAGTYNIQLIAENSSGCKDTASTSVQAFSIPQIDAGIDTTVCRGRNISLRASGAASYVWSPSNGLSCTNCATPICSPDSLQRYTVRGTTANGCTSFDTVIVNVTQPFNMLSSDGDTLCRGGNVRLFASGADTYQWSPTTGLSNANIANPLATPSTTTTYRVIGTDSKNCFIDTSYALIQVFPIPTIDAGQDRTINVGESITLEPTASADVTKITWIQHPSIVSTNGNYITVKPKETTTYTALATNAGGCKSKDDVTIFVICNGSNIFIPNTFTPNGDGKNDIFYPRGGGIFTIKTLRIFSRWGEVMYEKNNFAANDASAGWNGTYKGRVLTPDVYVYTIDVLCENNTVLTLKGNVALLQ